MLTKLKNGVIVVTQLDQSLQERALTRIEQLIKEEANANNMLPLARSEIQLAFDKNRAVTAFSGKKPIGYVYLHLWQHYIEISGIVVHPNFRQQGLGLILIKTALSLAKRSFDLPIIILPNKVSGKIAKQLGFTHKDKTFFHPEIWSTCPTCKDYQNFPKTTEHVSRFF